MLGTWSPNISASVDSILTILFISHKSHNFIVWGECNTKLKLLLQYDFWILIPTKILKN